LLSICLLEQPRGSCRKALRLGHALLVLDCDKGHDVGRQTEVWLAPRPWPLVTLQR